MAQNETQNGTNSYGEGLPNCFQEAYFKESLPLPEDTTIVEGYDFNNGIDFEKLLGAMKSTGYQAVHFARAVDEIHRMLACRDSPMAGNEEMDAEEEYRPKTNCTIFLGFTANLVTAGIRETVRFLVEHALVDVLVTTAGSIEEDIMKCFAPTYVGDFKMKGSFLREKAWNRNGNLLIPNVNYDRLEEFLFPLLKEMHREQDENNVNWTPSKMIAKMGEKVNDPKSILYWAFKNNIPIFSPAVTDGAIGEILFLYSRKHPGLKLDIVEDVSRIFKISVYSKNTGIVIAGGGISKHHICLSNAMRNGADFSVYINTAAEFDGSDGGASPDEAVSWGKIKVDAKPVKIVADATLIFPLLIAVTFAKYHHSKTKTE